ncbi:MAG: polyamine aminopropyltransferase [Lewinella sp.]|nr:polyamine aminopropyltransferase [Lewinella sp.]
MSIQRLISEKAAIIIGIFVAGLCSLIYELLISTTSSYFLGDSIRQFSLTIGIYMAAMGLGAFISQVLPEHSLAGLFILVEVSLGLIGGASVPVLYYAFEALSRLEYQLLMIGLTTVIGVLTGLEIPLLARIMKKYYPLRVNLANVMSLDYFGSLAATLLFPFLFLPFWGLFRTSLFFGLINVLLGAFILLLFSEHLSSRLRRGLWLSSIAVMSGFGLLFLWATPLLQRWDDQSFSHPVVFTQQTPYQHLALTRNRDEVRLYINRIIQFSSADEYRYHETLGLLPLQAAPYRERILILGGGEGLLARELLKDSAVQSITIVDLDPAVFQLATDNPYVSALNRGALTHPKVRTVAEDASIFLQTDTAYYDLIIADLPDPSNEAVARLYSTYFFGLARQRLTRFGLFATQATSPFHTRNGFWCIVETVRAAGFAHVLPYHTYVPSFGDWGFVIAAQQLVEVLPYRPRYPTRYLTPKVVEAMFDFPPDSDQPGPLRINRLDQPVLLDYYLADWAKWSAEKVN